MNRIYKHENSREALCSFEDYVLPLLAYPKETRMLQTRFGETHVLCCGDETKPALVLLHGAASNLLSWGGDIPQWMGDFYVIAPDIPGEAGKSAPVQLSWRGGDAADWIDDLLAALGIARASFIGMSLGGCFTLRYALQHPDKVEKIVLIAPGGIVPGRTSTIVRSLWYSLQKEKGYKKMERMVFGTGDVPEAALAFYRMIQQHMRPRYSALPLLTKKELAGIAAPMLVLLGESDALFDAQKAANRLKRLGISATIVPKGAHGMLNLAQMAAEFLKGG